MNVMNGRRIPASSLVWAAALVGVAIGVADFMAYELQGGPAFVSPRLLFKPTFLSPSLFSSQLFWFAALGVTSLALLAGLRRSLGTLGARFAPAWLPALVAVTCGSGVVAVRSYKYSSYAPGLAFLVGSCLAIVAASASLAGLLAHRQAASIRRIRTVLALCVCGSLGGAFAVPDLVDVVHDLRRSSPSPVPERPNVVLIVLDTVRADRLSCYGAAGAGTPNIDALANDSRLFLRAISAAPWTVPSHASMFTGLYPLEHRADWGSLLLSGELETLAERLGDLGFATVAFSENPFLGSSYGLAQGFAEFHETWRRPVVARAGAEIASRLFGYHDRREYARRTVRAFAHWTRHRPVPDRPFFAFLNFMAVHLPRYPRSGLVDTPAAAAALERIEPVNLVPERFYLPKFALDERELMVMSEVYSSELGYLDAQIGDLLSSLRRSGLLDASVLVLASDHGENIGDHGLIEHQFSVHNSLLHVPLMIRFPNRVPAARVTEIVSTVALPETILRLAGGSGQGSLNGSHHRSLLEAGGGGQVFADYSSAVEMLRDVLGFEAEQLDLSRFDQSFQCVMTEAFKYVLSSTGAEELYRLNVDFAELHNIAETEQERARAFREVLERRRMAISLDTDPSGALPVDPATSEALRALGYAR